MCRIHHSYICPNRVVADFRVCCPVFREPTGRLEFLKQAMAVAAAVAVAVPAANAAVVEPSEPLNFGKNPAQWSGGGKAKTGQVKTGNAGSIMKK